MNNGDNKNVPQCQPLVITLTLSFLINMHFLLSLSISVESFETVLDIMTIVSHITDNRILSYLMTVILTTFRKIVNVTQFVSNVIFSQTNEQRFLTMSSLAGIPL